MALTPKKTKKDVRIATLERKNRELEAELAHTFHFAEAGIRQATRERTMGSAVVVTMHYLGGKEVCPPFLLKDGLSDATIAALREDLRYGYAKAVEFKPSEAAV